MTFQNCGPNWTFPWRLGVAEWIEHEAYLAGCFAGLNYHGMCRHSLDVEIVSRNSHFLFHKWNIFCYRDLLIYAQILILRKSLDHLNVFLVLLPWILGGEPVLFCHRGKKCIENAVELQGQTLLNYSCNLSCFLCWSMLGKGLSLFLKSLTQK